MTDLDLTIPRGAEAPFRRGSPHAIAVHRVSESTFILRQSILDSYEAPFLYLLLGEDRALLLDTGATADGSIFALRQVVDSLVEAWLHRHPKDDYELIVAHSHAHGDHIAADGQFSDRARTRVVGHSAEDVADFFGLSLWPNGSAAFDLGGRSLRVIPTPGHHPTAITVYDENTTLLLTGDTVYPGRLYVSDFPAFLASLQALSAFGDTHAVAGVLGAHVEMSTRPRQDFPRGSKSHPEERELLMTLDDLHAIRRAAVQIAHRPGAHRFASFIIWNGPCRREAAAQRARLVLSRIVARLHPSARAERRPQFER